MTETKKYSTAYYNAGSWRNPQYCNGAEDNLCASKSTALLGNYYLQAKTYGFSIPADATITGVFMAAKGQEYYQCGDILYFYIIPPLSVWNHNVYITLPCVSSPSGDRCALSSMSSEVDLTSIGYGAWTPADFNSETFQTWWWWRSFGTGTAEADLDAAYLRVTYTEAAAVQPRGDGLTWIQLIKKREIESFLHNRSSRSFLPLSRRSSLHNERSDFNHRINQLDESFSKNFLRSSNVRVHDITSREKCRCCH